MNVLIVAGLGAVEIWAAVPAGFALRMHPVTIGVATAAGALLGAAVVVALGDRVREWLLRRRPGGARERGRAGVVRRVWQRYGIVGLGLLAPLLTGAPLGAALGLVLGARPRPLLIWISIGAILWTAGLTLAGALGVAGIEALAR